MRAVKSFLFFFFFSFFSHLPLNLHYLVHLMYRQLQVAEKSTGFKKSNLSQNALSLPSVYSVFVRHSAQTFTQAPFFPFSALIHHTRHLRASVITVFMVVNTIFKVAMTPLPLQKCCFQSHGDLWMIILLEKRLKLSMNVLYIQVTLQIRSEMVLVSWITSKKIKKSVTAYKITFILGVDRSSVVV